MSVSFHAVSYDKSHMYLFHLKPTEDSKYKLIASRLDYNGEAYFKSKSYNEIIAVILRDEDSYFMKIVERDLDQAKSCFIRINQNILGCEERGNNLYIYLKYDQDRYIAAPQSNLPCLPYRF